MPKNSKTVAQRATSFANTFKRNGIEADGVKLICRTCGTFLGDGSIMKSQIDQHVKSKKHTENVKSQKNQVRIDQDNPKPYLRDLCKAFISADIPLTKLQNPELSDFLQKYTHMKTPDESTLRRNFVEDLYKETVQEIRNEIGEGPIWISIDETTDAQGRFIANVIVGKMSIEPQPAFLLYCTELTATNSETIAKIFHEAIQLLWPKNTTKYMDRVFVFITDAAPYMVKASKSLKVLFTNMVHITCAAHGLHRVCETVRVEFPLVNALISNVKKIFLKAPSRVLLFKTMYPNLPLPPEPITTRWGTWVKAAEYYSDHFSDIVEVVNALEDDAESIRQAKELIKDTDLMQQLTTIKMYYVCLANIITKLESRNLTLEMSLNLVQEAETALENAPQKKIKDKLNAVLKKNVGLTAVRSLTSKNSSEKMKYDHFKKLSPTDFACFKYAPIVSCEVERSFSIYKHVLSERRRRFHVDTLAMHLVIICKGKRD